MKQQAFEERYQQSWQLFETQLGRLEKGVGVHVESDSEADFPALYRSVCHHLALAKDRHYSPHLINRLHTLVLRGHQLLYTQKRPFIAQIVQFLLRDFPAALRREARLLWLSTALFVLPALVMGWLCFNDREMIYAVHSPLGVMEMEAMYDPNNSAIGREERQSDSDFFMFGFYIYNNIGIGFRTFAGGLLYGVGTLIVLISNGVFIGSVAGHLTQRGFTDTFWPFVSGHGAFELTAIVICGVAGLQLARALYAPGRHGRVNALKKASGEAVPLVIGAGLMLFIAAFVEAFWSSSSTVTKEIKYGVAAMLWLLVICYFLFAGRGRGEDGSR